MRRLIFTVLACIALSATTGLASDEKQEADKAATSDRAQLTKFFKDHVIGKTVATPKTTFKLHDNKMAGEYEDFTTFSSFAETAQGFSFDVTSVSKETRYDLDKNGKRLVPARDNGGTEVYRFEFCERVSTKKVTGVGRRLVSTIKGPSHEATAILVTGLKVAHGKLTWNETLVGYTDFIAGKGKYKAGSWDAKYTFSVVDGKLLTAYEAKRFDVDPDTLKRTPTNDKVPVFVAREIDAK